MAGVRVVGVERVSQRLQRLGKLSSDAVREGTKKTMEQIARQERTLLSLGWHKIGTKTGSVPPDPPWRITGELSRSVMVEGPIKFGALGRWVGRVGAYAVYARIHELGGWAGRDHQTYLPPRPHLKPAVDIVMPKIRFIYEHELRRRFDFGD
jgi:hypothetical protein